MSLVAVRLPRMLRGDTDASQGVFARSDQLQVPNISTGSDSAEMIDLEMWRDNTVSMLPYNTVDEAHFPMEPGHTVATSAQRPSPHEATRFRHGLQIGVDFIN